MPGSSGKWKPNWKNKSIWHWKSILWTSLFFIGVLIFVVFFTRSGFFYVFPLNSRLLWLFLFTLFSIPGFYIGQLEYDMLKKDTHKLLQFNIFNTLIVLIPFFLQTLLFLILGSTSGFLGGIHGLVILMIVFLIGPIVRKISNNPLLTAIIQSFLLQLLVIPQGSLFLVFY